MTKALNQTIRTLKRALRELDYVEVEDYVLYETEGVGYVGIGTYFSERLNEARYQTKILIDDLEMKYQKMHKIGAYRSD